MATTEEPSEVKSKVKKHRKRMKALYSQIKEQVHLYCAYLIQSHTATGSKSFSFLCELEIPDDQHSSTKF